MGAKAGIWKSRVEAQLLLVVETHPLFSPRRSTGASARAFS